MILGTGFIVVIIYNRTIKEPGKRENDQRVIVPSKTKKEKKRERSACDRALKNEKREKGGTISV